MLAHDLIELGDDLLAALRAMLGVGREHAADEQREPLGHVWRDLGERLVLTASNLADDFFWLRARERHRAGGQQVQDHAEREQIRPMIGLAVHRRLGRHVRPLAYDQRLGVLGDRGHRDAEVQQLHRAVVAEDDVVRRDVAMHDRQPVPGKVGRPVGVMQRLRDLANDEAGLAERHRRLARAQLLGHFAQVAAVHEFHREVQSAADLADVEHLDDVRVHEPARNFRFIQEQLDRLPAAVE